MSRCAIERKSFTADRSRGVVNPEPSHQRNTGKPLLIRLANGLLAALAAALPVRAVIHDPRFWQLQTLNEVFCGVLLFGAAVTGVLGILRGPPVYKACAVLGWWVGFGSILSERGLANAVPILGLAIFLTAGCIADVVTDSEPAVPDAQREEVDAPKAPEIDFRRFAPGL